MLTIHVMGDGNGNICPQWKASTILYYWSFYQYVSILWLFSPRLSIIIIFFLCAPLSQLLNSWKNDYNFSLKRTWINTTELTHNNAQYSRDRDRDVWIRFINGEKYHISTCLPFDIARHIVYFHFHFTSATGGKKWKGSSKKLVSFCS